MSILGAGYSLPIGYDGLLCESITISVTHYLNSALQALTRIGRILLSTALILLSPHMPLMRPDATLMSALQALASLIKCC